MYNQYYLALVQNFENNYGLDVDVEDSETEISGTLLNGQPDHFIYYDEMPRAVYEQNKNTVLFHRRAYSVVVKPLPPGYYESLQGYNLIEADRWTVQRGPLLTSCLTLQMQ